MQISDCGFWELNDWWKGGGIQLLLNVSMLHSAFRPIGVNHHFGLNVCIFLKMLISILLARRLKHYAQPLIDERTPRGVWQSVRPQKQVSQSLSSCAPFCAYAVQLENMYVTWRKCAT